MKFLVAATAFALMSAGAAHSADVKVVKKFNEWILIQHEDPMTDAKQCFLSYGKDKTITYNTDNTFRISYEGRGGVSDFQYRFGKAGASDLMSVKDYEGNLIKIPALLVETLDQPNLRVTGQKVIGGGIDLNVNLKGLKAGREAMATLCEVSDLPSIKDEKRTWANWQVTPPQK